MDDMTSSRLELAFFVFCARGCVCALHGHERSQQFLNFQAIYRRSRQIWELQTTVYVAGKFGVSYYFFNRKPAILGNLKLFLYTVNLAFLISNEAGKFSVSYFNSVSYFKRSWKAKKT